MRIRRRIVRTYLVLILIVLFYMFLAGVTHSTRVRVETDRNEILELKNVWSGAQVALSDMIIDWNDGRSYRRLLERRRVFDARLSEMQTRMHTARIYPSTLTSRFENLGEIWEMADDHLTRITRAVEHPDFRTVEGQLQRQPGLQRLSHLWVELADSDALRDRRLAHTIQEFFGEVEFFSLYSETVDNLLDVILAEAAVVHDRVVILERIARVLFFLAFLVAYGLISLRFSRSLSEPITRVAHRLGEFVGLTGAQEVYNDEDEILVLTATVDYMIAHYTELAERAKRLANGHIEAETTVFPPEGVVERSLTEIATYLRELARTSTWIRDGKYGARIQERSDRDVLAHNFNVMSSVIHEKISTLQGMFEAVDEGVLVLDEQCQVHEVNARFLSLFGLESVGSKQRDSQLGAVVEQFTPFFAETAGGDSRHEIYANLLSPRNGEIPVKLTSRLLETTGPARKQVMFLVTDESQRARQKRERDRLKAQATEAELKALRAQINPHFLFNTLNTIAYLVETDTDGAVGTIEKLADLFRYALASTDRETVPLVEELHQVQRFLEIERLRYGDRLRIRIDTDDRLDNQPIQPMLLQPLVENAVRYGADEDGTVNVEIRVERDRWYMRIQVCDNGASGTAPESLLQKPGTGIRNVNSRLKTLYARPLVYRRNEPYGIVAELLIPVEVS